MTDGIILAVMSNYYLHGQIQYNPLELGVIPTFVRITPQNRRLDRMDFITLISKHLVYFVATTAKFQAYFRNPGILFNQ
jgi:hypothetical protein